MKPKFLKTVRLGHHNIDLFVLPDDSGGSFNFAPDNTSRPRMTIGLDYDDWENCLSTILHEAFEFAFCLQDCRYLHSGKISADEADLLFVFDHSRFSRACSMAAFFLVDAIPLLATEWKKQHPK